MARLNIGLVATFGRDEQFGGSQRATAIAERLEARGANVEWKQVRPRALSRGSRIRAALTLTPDQIARHSGATVAGRDGEIRLFEQSFVAAALGPVPGRDVVDFHDIEWRALDEVATLQPSVARRGWLRLQSVLLRRAEARVVRRQPCLFVRDEERGWAVEQGADPAHMVVVPNLLPRSGQEEAARVWEAREQSLPLPQLTYMGKVSHRPNYLALKRFLDAHWGALREERPDLTLNVIGRTDAASTESLGSYPGVKLEGFVPDATEHLARTAAAILPFDTSGGSSLRVLFYALAGVPLVGSSSAFRGFPAGLGSVAATGEDWRAHLHRLLGASQEELLAEGRERRDAAVALHDDPEPWDRLYAQLAG